jgi:hypothetical protein
VEALGGEEKEFRQLWIAVRDAMDVIGAATKVAGGRGVSPTANEDAEESADAINAEVDLQEKVSAAIATILRTTPDQLKINADGDISIRAGSAMVFVRVRHNPPLLDVFSPILTGVEPSLKLYAKLSDLTNRMPIGRLYWIDGTVWASIPVFGRNFQAAHLILAIQVMTGLADELDDRLHGEFGGRRFFGGPPDGGNSDASENS